MFSSASSKLRASKHGSFPSIDSWSSSEWMFAKDGYNERWYWTSDCTYNTVVEMNHPETQSITTLTQRVQHKADTSIKSLPNLLLFNNNCSTRTLTLFVTTSGFLLISSLIRRNYSHLYWRYNSNISFLLHIKFKIGICYYWCTFCRNSINQSINQCSELHFVA